MKHAPYDDAPTFTVHAPQALWINALRAADHNHETIEAVITRSLRNYINNTTKDTQ